MRSNTKSISIYIPIDVKARIQEYIAQKQYKGFSDFFKEALAWIYQHPEKPLMEDLYVNQCVTMCVCFQTAIIDQLQNYLDQFPRQIDRSRFFRIVSKYYLHDLTIPKPITIEPVYPSNEIHFSDGTIRHIILKESRSV